MFKNLFSDKGRNVVAIILMTTIVVSTVYNQLQIRKTYAELLEDL